MQELERITYHRGPHVDEARQTGVVFHVIGCLTELGRVGIAAVGESPSTTQTADAAVPRPTGLGRLGSAYAVSA